MGVLASGSATKRVTASSTASANSSETGAPGLVPVEGREQLVVGFGVDADRGHGRGRNTGSSATPSGQSSRYRLARPRIAQANTHVLTGHKVPSFIDTPLPHTDWRFAHRLDADGGPPKLSVIGYHCKLWNVN